jgi:hypothetical protein
LTFSSTFTPILRKQSLKNVDGSPETKPRASGARGVARMTSTAKIEKFFLQCLQAQDATSQDGLSLCETRRM